MLKAHTRIKCIANKFEYLHGCDVLIAGNSYLITEVTPDGIRVVCELGFPNFVSNAQVEKHFGETPEASLPEKLGVGPATTFHDLLPGWQAEVRALRLEVREVFDSLKVGDCVRVEFTPFKYSFARRAIEREIACTRNKYRISVKAHKRDHAFVFTKLDSLIKEFPTRPTGPTHIL